jgi:lipopolysaccharide export system protein LptA
MRPMKHVVAGLVVVLFVGSLLNAAGAANEYLALGDRSASPIDVSARRFQARNTGEGKEGIFDGNVKVQQDDVTLNCDQLVISWEEQKSERGSQSRSKGLPGDLQAASRIRSITAQGNVKIVQNERMAVAGRAVFDNVKRTITLTGGPPKVNQGPDWMTAQTIVIYLDENRVELVSPGSDGSRTNGRTEEVNVRINPPTREKQQISPTSSDVERTNGRDERVKGRIHPPTREN